MIENLNPQEGQYVECANGSFGVVRGKYVVWLLQPDSTHVHDGPTELPGARLFLKRIVTKEEYTMLLLER